MPSQRKRKRRAIEAGLVLCVCALVASPCRGSGLFEGEWWRGTLDLGATADSNPFRVSDDAEAEGILGGRSVHGVGSTARAMFEAGWQVSRQRIHLDGAVVRTSTDDGGVLDHTTSDFGARWLWAVGPHWYGEIGARRYGDLSPIEDVQLFADDVSEIAGIIRDPRIHERFDGSATYRYHPEWHVRIGAVRHEVHYELDSRVPYGNRQEVFNLEWTHQPRSEGSSSGIWASTTEVTFLAPITVTEGLSTDRYRENEGRIVLHWDVSARSRIGGYGGYLERRYDALEGWDQAGPVGRIYWQWALGPRTDVELSAHRRMGAFLELETPSMGETGGALSATWRPTPKVEIAVSGNAGRADFVGSAGASVKRSDELWNWDASIVYALHRAVEFTLSGASAERRSSLDAADYMAVGAWAGLRLRI